MNEQELANLLAQTHARPSLHSYAPSARSDQSSQNHMRSPNSPLSPRQVFQSRVRTLGDDEHPRAGRQTSPTRKSRELQHLSSLRVNVKSNNDSRVNCRPQTGQVRDGRFDISSEEPDFIAEERAAWNRQTPERKAQHKPCGSGKGLEDDVTLSEDRLGQNSPDKQTPALTVFGPLSNETDPNERPKTSRGLKQPLEDMQAALPQGESRAGDRDIRRSKFSEGTMTDRSNGISSTWQDHGSRISESSERAPADTDSDSAPQAAHLPRDADSSSDLCDFQPVAATSGSVKQRFSRLAQSLKPLEDSSKPPQQMQKPKRKGLRKSISNWNFQSIGEKMKFFGASTHDLAEPAGPMKAQHDGSKELLDERKRKAEEAYTQQFGTKKRKSNDCIAVETRPASRAKAQPKTLKKRSESEEQTTIPVRAAVRRQTSPRSTKSNLQSSVETSSNNERGLRKRASRKELEKENQQLRALLREQQAQQQASMQRSASKSTVHLPFSNPDLLLPQPTSSVPTHRQSITSTGPSRSGRQKQYQQDIPPVPALPSRAALSHLSNTNGRSHTLKSFGAGRGFSGGLEGRPVSTIFEEQDSGADGKENSNQQSHANSQKIFNRIDHTHQKKQAGIGSDQGDKWKWPDDVF